MTQTPHVPSTEPELTGVRNFRDLGGLPAADGRRVRPGVLFRSGHLAHATESDTRFLGSLGLHTVFDFRNAADIELDGVDVELTGVRQVNIPLNDPADGAEFWRMVRARDLTRLRDALSGTRGVDRMTETYREIITTRTAEQGRVLHTLAEDAVPALMHCAAGKDRAGLSIAVTLLALGATRETVEADYLKSNAPHRRHRMHLAEGAGAAELEVAELLSPMFEARAEYLAVAFATIDEIWGTTERYLTKGLGFDGADRERLRDRLLTD
ncbi:protein tyrosine phosphatase [Streptomyces eurocidicus]|uniref:Protein tyrosine phosphatase n=1 Tax=Streptomyces eurocidicus TaxID=66423 RepID=A0A2N8NZD0_STREU|nr:tyrosine-protein phosphatase [Streptomyces eurocidicus]MBB5120816.1 protein-tyrosine phosphatase [Streptomyces eurocidicus]MBF6054238.1 protein-tyrosine-phosphatase [Streptomyces eurocidicus]PNE34119.1 protein tyrosine phosphatase [Streptomyces eurocidicus]